MKKAILLLGMFFFCCQICFSQAGELDPSFGDKGIVTADLGEGVTYPSAGKKVLLLPDGSMFVIFNYLPFESAPSAFISKRHPDGSPDISYGRKGFSDPVNMDGNDAALQEDGKIVIAGSSNSDFTIARFNADGSVDSSFSNDGVQTTDFNSTIDVANAVVIQNDGKIVVVGSASGSSSNFSIARYNTDGSLDNSFSTDGKEITGFEFNSSAVSVAIQTDGKIVASGNEGYKNISDFAIARYNVDGTLDATFSDDGKQTTDFGFLDYISSVAIQPDGKIVAAGYIYDSTFYYRSFALARYDTDGNLDTDFSNNGKQITKFFDSIGTPLVSYISCMTIEKNGKIVVAGSVEHQNIDYDWYYDLAIARYNTNGSLDNSFSNDGKLRIAAKDGYEYYTAHSIIIEDDAKIVVAGTNNSFCFTKMGECPSSFALSRINTNGTPDTAFNGDGTLLDKLRQGNTSFRSTAVQKDGKIIVAGVTSNSGNNFAVVRYNTDGSLDSTFSSDGIQAIDFAGAGAVAIQSDGKIVAAGSNFAVARFNTDGTLDSTFDSNGKRSGSFNYHANSVAIQSDGKIVVGGSMGNGPSDFAIARFNTDGTLDATFSGNGIQTTDFGSSDNISSIAIQTDGKIVAAGITVSGRYGNIVDFAIARYSADGTLDATFSGDGKQTTKGGSISSIAIQTDGKIVAAGSSYINNKWQFVLLRYNIDGNLDSSFSGDGQQNTNFDDYFNSASSVAIQDNGKIVVAGSNNTTDFELVRYNTDGSLDSTFSNDGIQTTNASTQSDFISGIAIAGNKLYVAGFEQYPGNLGVVARYFLDDREKTAPTVALTTPTNNAFYLAPANLKLSATASDSDGSITKVEFYNGNTLLHRETVTPYGFVWRNVPLGNYTLTAKAYDNSGLVTTSAPVHISVVPNKPPMVSIVKPRNSQPFVAPGYIHFEADAKDADGRITRVEFYNGSTLLNTQYQYPYTFVWKDVPVGTYTITTVAVDNWGAQTTSEPVAVKVIPGNTAIVSNKPTSVNNKTNTDESVSMRLLPNPVANVLHIYTVGLQQNKPLNILVISSSGALMRTMQSNSSSKVLQLNVSSLISGVYAVKLICGERVFYKQFVKH